MSDRPQHDGRRRLTPVAAVVAAAATALTGAAVLAVGLRGPDDGPPAAPERTAVVAAPDPSAAPPSPAAPAAPDPGPAPPVAAGAPAADLGPVLPASDPVALSIPSIGVASDVLEPLALDAAGVLPAPTDYALPGWYTGGPRPGQFGPAVVAGHVDGPDGPAVFYRLGELAVGANVEVTRADGTVATFVVDAVERYAKAEFPTSRVYGNTTDRAELRLITCGGAFDRTTGHYVDNIVAYAHLV
ncbi:class F sortase [Cellulomonas aerilata]|uniref:Class F sortase n=1 Tax=Cellulomonas aerilata TaxID=515326 RepID=A0A512D8H0_9CELL|nr:class F sortase [Cellulomonas aerilata]GEO32570.1 hypothetical protein CAE01nite_02950 [Cellulomonas aerilata]